MSRPSIPLAAAYRHLVVKLADRPGELILQNLGNAGPSVHSSPIARVGSFRVIDTCSGAPSLSSEEATAGVAAGPLHAGRADLTW